MNLTRRGKVVLSVLVLVVFFFLLSLAGKMDLETECQMGSQSACDAIH